MYLSIIIPAFNEEKRLPITLQDIANFLKTFSPSVEVLVVDDGSTDRTVKVAEEMRKDIPALRVLHFEQNHGKGYVVKHGMLQAGGDLVLFMDADNSTPLSEISKLLPFSKKFEVVIGSRHLKTSNVVIKQPWYRILLSRFGNILIQSLIVRNIVDTQCGFKLFQREACRHIFSRQQTNGFGFDMEILAIAQKVFGYQIKEVPVSWYDAPNSRIRPVRDAWRTFKELIRIRMNLSKGIYR